ISFPIRFIETGNEQVFNRGNRLFQICLRDCLISEFAFAFGKCPQCGNHKLPQTEFSASCSRQLVIALCLDSVLLTSERFCSTRKRLDLDVASVVYFAE